MEVEKRILVTGAVGQIGSELVPLLRSIHEPSNVIAVGNRTQPSDELRNGGPFETADVTDKEALRAVIVKYNVNVIYHLASLLSATSERDPDLAWDINLNSLKDVLDLAKEYKLQVFWPSSIGAFGPTTPQKDTPQRTVLEPTSMYGVTKVAGELLCNYYYTRYGVDVRSLRYPGIISYKTEPGGGTTDYAVSIFYGAIKEKKYECYLRQDSALPMIYMPDALKATIDLMNADPCSVKVRTSYNLTAFSFTPSRLAEIIQHRLPEFTCSYENICPIRQGIANSWPDSIDDSAARSDWGWKEDYTLEKMVDDMLVKLKEKLSS